MNNREILVTHKNQEMKVHLHQDKLNVTEVRFKLVFPYIKQALSELNIDVEFIINVCDLCDSIEPDIKIICFSKTKKLDHILIPNIDFFSGLIFRVIQQSSNDISYSDKLNSSVFAGANTGGFNRIEYCNKIFSHENNIGVIRHVENTIDNIRKLYPDYEKLFGSLSIPDQLKHKIVVNIDGHSLCWSRLYWQMNSNSIPVYINQRTDHEQYFDKFDDTDCYFSATMDNFEEVYDYILDPKNIDHVNQVNENGKRFIRTHFAEYVKNPQLFLLNSVKDAIRKVNEKYHKL